MAENHVLLETIELTQSVSSITFDNIPQTGYTDLKILVSARTNGTSFGSSPWQNVSVALNSTSPTSTKQAYATVAGVGTDSQASGLWATNSNATTDVFSNNEIYLLNYLESNGKVLTVDSSTENNGTDGARVFWSAYYSTVTAAVTSITLTPVSGSFLANSTFSFYAVAAKATTPATAPKATGGNIVANDGTYWYHAFLTSGYFTPQTNLTCDYLVVAGGGAGGVGAGSWGGGGGAGGYRTTLDSTAQAFALGTNYFCTVGAGGVGTANRGTTNTSGNNSSIIGGSISFSATGGGRGGNEAFFQTGGNGGSGGGGNYQANPGSGNAGGYTPVEGYAGATARSGNNSSGGGGAAAVGSTLNGGAGRNTNSAWATATTTGVSGYYAGGGGSGDYPAMTSGSGGLGGGGNGSPNGTGPGVAGVRGTGGGGGGSNGNGTHAGGNGGSGIIIIRYPMVS